MSNWFNRSPQPNPNAADYRLGRRPVPADDPARRSTAIPRETAGLQNIPELPPVDFEGLNRGAMDAAKVQRKKAAKFALLAEGQPADAAETSPPARLERRRLSSLVGY